jgi:hypothetical protein
VELPLVQILVVVANIQLWIFYDLSLKAEVGKGFVSTAIGHESLGTKPNVGPHMWNGVIALLVRWGLHT